MDKSDLTTNAIGWVTLVATARRHVAKISGAIKDEELLRNKLRRALPKAADAVIDIAPDAIKETTDGISIFHYFSDAKNFPTEGYYDNVGVLQVRGKIKKEYLHPRG